MECWRIRGLHPNSLSTPISSGTCKGTNFKFGKYIHSVYPNKSPLTIWEKRERGRIQGLPKFFECPLLSQERVKLRTSNLADVFRASMQTKAPYYLVEKGACAYPRTVQISRVPPIISVTRKATNFKLGRYSYRVHPNKSPVKIWEKRERGRIQRL